MTIPALPAAAVERLVADGAALVDVRDRESFAAGHVPGSLNVELGEGFGQYLGWLVPPTQAIVLLADEPGSVAAAASAEATTMLARSSHRVVGRVLGGAPGWQASGRTLRRYPVSTMRELFDLVISERRTVRILDVRPAAEWAADGGLPGSERIFVPDLPDRIAEFAETAAGVAGPAGNAEPTRGAEPTESVEPSSPWWVLCTTGVRAAVAASYLDGHGVPVRLVGRGGVIGWVERFEAAASPTS